MEAAGLALLAGGQEAAPEGPDVDGGQEGDDERPDIESRDQASETEEKNSLNGVKSSVPGILERRGKSVQEC